jgi:hypothetical protein
VRLRYVRDGEAGEYTFRPAVAVSRETLHAMEEIFAVGFHRDCQRMLGTSKELQPSIAARAGYDPTAPPGVDLCQN